MIENTIQQLAAHGIEIADRVTSALAVIDAARSHRGTSRDAAAELSAAFHAGDLDAQNFGDKLRDACVAQITSQTGVNGAIAWQAALAVENVADTTIRQWLAIEWEDILDHFAPQLDEAAAKLAAALPRALPIGSDPDTVIKYGKRGIEAATIVGEAESDLSRVVGFLRTVAGEIDEELPIHRFASGDDTAPPVETGVWAGYLRDGYSIGLVSVDRAAQAEAIAAQITREAEIEEWRPKIRAEAQRLADLRDRGLRPNWSAALPVPDEFAYLIAEEVEKLGFSENQFERARPVTVS